MNQFFLFSVWKTSFRPFFLFGTAFSGIAIGFWLGILFELLPNPIAIDSIKWHSYEMVFGFSRAIVLGFLFTAAQNWTGKTILKGRSLFLLFVLWFLGRFSFFSEEWFSFLSFGLDLSCDIMVLFLLIPRMYAVGQDHNRIIANLYFLLAILHSVTGYSLLTDEFEGKTMSLIHLSMFVIVMYIVIIAGRIVPFFTRVVVNNYSHFPNEILEKILIHFVYMFFVIQLIVIWESDLRFFAGLFSFAFGLLNFYRLIVWKPWMAKHIPILFILYLGYFWLSLGFVLYGFAEMNYAPMSVSIHSVTVGGIGVFTYGMITRVSLGHTGRKIIAGKMVVLGYLLMNIAVITRVVLPFFEIFKEAYLFSGLAWILSSILFLVQYSSILLKPRPDGKDI